jgi:hypothetical protein
MLKRTGALAAMGALVVAAAAAVAYAAPKNGSFESGFDPGWKTYSSNPLSGKWRTYKAGDEPSVGPVRAYRRGLGPGTGIRPFFDPPRGKRAAVTDQTGPGTRILSRTLKLKAHRKIRLSLFVFYRNYADDFYSPNTLDAGSPMPRRRGAQANQQYRIDLLKPSAPRGSVAGADILKTLFRTRHGDPRKLKPKRLRFNVSKFAGQKVRLRFAEVDNRSYLHAGTDAVKLRYKPLD